MTCEVGSYNVIPAKLIEIIKITFLFDFLKEFLLYFLFLVMSAIFVSQWGVHT